MGTSSPCGSAAAHVEQSFSDILENLDAAFFVSGTARQGRWVLHGDASHASASRSAALPLGLSARAKVRQTSVTLTGGYNWQWAKQSSVDFLAGARLWDIDASVTLPGIAAVQSSTSFVDPVVAVRWRYDFAPQWSSLVYVDTGGWGGLRRHVADAGHHQLPVARKYSLFAGLSPLAGQLPQSRQAAGLQPRRAAGGRHLPVLNTLRRSMAREGMLPPPPPHAPLRGLRFMQAQMPVRCTA